jgi:hypothetical protein
VSRRLRRRRRRRRRRRLWACAEINDALSLRPGASESGGGAGAGAERGNRIRRGRGGSAGGCSTPEHGHTNRACEGVRSRFARAPINCVQRVTRTRIRFDCAHGMARTGIRSGLAGRRRAGGPWARFRPNFRGRHGVARHVPQLGQPDSEPVTCRFQAQAPAPPWLHWDTAGGQATESHHQWLLPAAPAACPVTRTPATRPATTRAG